MNLKNIIFTFLVLIILNSCANYQITPKSKKADRTYYSSKGFALIYADDLYEEKVIKKKLNIEKFEVMHKLMKRNTPIKIINLDNSKVYETLINKSGDYPKIFNVVITRKIAELLQLDLDNPYVEIIELKKNKTFIAKKSNTFEEEKNVAESAPVDEITMSVLSKENKVIKKNKVKKNFILVISDFYYENSAINLMNELKKETNINKFYINKISNNKYRLSAGPFKNFNALKSTYISINNLGFEDLNIYRE